MNRHITKIPGKSEWAGYEADLDVRYAYNLYFGKNIAEVQPFFGEMRSIERADELLFAPRRVFQYYVFAFAEYLQSEPAMGDSDSASPFLHLLVEREKRDPGSVAQIYAELAPTVEYVASRQKYFDADPEIYGSFRELAEQIEAVCNAPHVRRK